MYIHETITPIRMFWKAFFSKPLLRSVQEQVFYEQIIIIFTAEFS